METFLMSQTIKRKLPSLPFRLYKEKILGANYSLSLTFIGTKRMRALNNKWRKKDYATDILSFPYEKKSGEIFICIEAANKKSKEFDRNPKNYLAFLVIHGLIHLKGFDHGSRMENEEIKWRKKFGI